MNLQGHIRTQSLPSQCTAAFNNHQFCRIDPGCSQLLFGLLPGFNTGASQNEFVHRQFGNPPGFFQLFEKAGSFLEALAQFVSESAQVPPGNHVLGFQFVGGSAKQRKTNIDAHGGISGLGIL
jgi:hypothetical protein